MHESKYCEHFDLILIGQLCIDQSQWSSGHVSKPQSILQTSVVAICSLIFACLIGFFLATEAVTFQKYIWCWWFSEFHQLNLIFDIYFFCLRPLLDYWQVVTLIARVFIGIAVGHVYYFLEDVFPEHQGGFKILKTPRIM